MTTSKNAEMWALGLVRAEAMGADDYCLNCGYPFDSGDKVYTPQGDRGVSYCSLSCARNCLEMEALS